MNEEIHGEGRWVVGTDGSDQSSQAIQWAAKHAVQRQTPTKLLIIHSIPPLVTQPHVGGAMVMLDGGMNYVQVVRKQAEQFVSSAAERIRKDYPDLIVETAVVEGHPAQVLTEVAGVADQIVVGARGKGTPALSKMLGGVASHVVSNAKGTVVVIPDQAEDRDDAPVVVGIDDSPQGRLAISRAFQAASLRRVPLIAITAWDFGPYDLATTEIWQLGADEMDEALTAEAEELIEDERKAHPDVEVTVKAVRGRPETALVEASKAASLLVVGSKGRGGFASLLLGSTSRHVLRESYCPVVITRAPAGWKDRSGRV